MSHFAKIENSTVTQVIVVEQDVLDTGLFGDPSLWVQTSYNTLGGVHTLGGTPLRKNYASVGYISGAEVQFAGGGGGGEDANNGALTYQAQGQAGGGQGATYINGAIALAGQAYTGSGGGGACHVGNSTETSGNGGKGVVIIQYPGTVALATGGDIIDITGGYVTHIFKNSGSFTPGY